MASAVPEGEYSTIAGEVDRVSANAPRQVVDAGAIQEMLPVSAEFRS